MHQNPVKKTQIVMKVIEKELKNIFYFNTCFEDNGFILSIFFSDFNKIYTLSEFEKIKKNIL